MGRRGGGNKGRPVNGILLLDKPAGLSSNAALQQVKRLFRARKAGHTGNLDPLATGMLPICFGQATKVSAFLLDAAKYYRVTMKLGEQTTTGDAEGEVSATGPANTTVVARVVAVLDKFHGEIEQIPPMYSALKHKGERLYKLAREGREVERPPRRVTIHSLQLIEHGADHLTLDVHCSKGTYVRTLVEDLAAAAGSCAHVSALRRLGVGPYMDAPMWTLEALEAIAVEEGESGLDRLCLPLDSALSEWPEVEVTGDSAYYLRRGNPVLVPRSPARGWVRLYESAGRFMGMGEILDDGRVAPRRLMSAAGER